MKCRFCQKIFPNIYEWDQHEQIVHGRDGSINKNKLKKLEKSRCFICSFGCSDGKSLNRHLREAHNYDKKLGMVNIKGADCLRCFHCIETFNVTSKLGLIRHLIEHHFPSLRPKFECKFCSKTYRNEVTLKDHIDGIHCKKTKCHLCDKIFASDEGLRNHVKGIHEKGFMCPKCKGCFSCKKALNTHTKHRRCKNENLDKVDKVKPIKNLKLLESLKQSEKRTSITKKFRYSSKSYYLFLESKHRQIINFLQLSEGVYHCRFCDFKSKTLPYTHFKSV